MHDIDRTQLETGWDGGEFEEWEYEDPYGEYEESYGEFEDPYGEYEESYGEYEDSYGEVYGEVGYESPFSESEEMELASELLSLGSEAEMDQFLGKLFRKVGRTFKKIVRSPIGRALGGVLKGIAKKALPIAGGALGSFIPIPGVGTAVGTALGSAAGKMFGLELEGLSPEDQEFEVARRFVRLAGDAAKVAAAAPTSANPQLVANRATAIAAQKHAPGLARGAMARRRPGQAGRWIRRGRAIILLGA